MNIYRFYGDEGWHVAAGSKREQDAGSLLAALAALREPITESELKAWFGPVVAITKSGTMPPDEIETRWNGVAYTFAGKPKFLFSDELRREVLMKYSWLPTPAEVWAVAEPTYKEFEAILSALNRMLKRRYDAPLPTPDEITANGWVMLAPEVVPIRLAPPSEGAGA
jgi:hypothetical protein